MKITVFGAGYVGLVTSVCFADLGNEVLCVEKSLPKLEKLNKGISPIYEVGITEILQRNIKEGRLSFTDDIKEAVNFSDVIFICVGTPQNEKGEADLSQVEDVVKSVSQYMDGYKLIIEKSTVPVNTHKWIENIINESLSKPIEFDIASNPEFLKEGTSIYDFMNPNRIIVGVESKKAEDVFKKLYEPFIRKGHFLFITTPAEAELIKYASNSFLALKISYTNMLAQLCEKVEANIEEVSYGIGLDDRIGTHFLNAGIGYGGSCLPKDVRAFINTADEYGIKFYILKEAERVNLDIRHHFVQKIKKTLKSGNINNIAIWGLSFKPNTDDIRDAPSITIVNELSKSNVNLRLYDPEAIENFKVLFPENENIKYFDNKYDALNGVDALIINTEWSEFTDADLYEMIKIMKMPIIMDGRNIYDLEIMNKLGIEYYSIGRNDVSRRDNDIIEDISLTLTTNSKFETK